MALQKNHNNSRIMRPEDSNDGEAVIDAGDLECEDTDAGEIARVTVMLAKITLRAMTTSYLL